MKIKVFTTINESYDSGDLNDSHKKYFMTKELRDSYFNFLRKDYLENVGLEEYQENCFHEKTGSQSWAYSIEKGEEELEIIESEAW
jgi:hypothetical protein